MLSPVIFNGGRVSTCMSRHHMPTCTSRHHMPIWCRWRTEGNIKPPRTEATDYCDLPSSCQEETLGPLEDLSRPSLHLFYNSSMYIHIWGSLETPHNCSQKSPQRLPLMFTVDMTMCFLPFAPTALFLDFCVIIDGSVHETGTPKEQHPHLTMTTETITGQTEKNQRS